VEGSRRLGAILLAVGILMIAAGGAGALGLVGGAPVSSPGPVAGGSPGTSTVPTSAAPTVLPTGVATSGPSQTLDAALAVRAFFDDLVAAIRAGNVSVMGARLNGAVIDRYGVAACEAELAGRAADPTYAVAITSIHEPAPWDYVSDGRTTTIAETWTVDAMVTAEGTSATRELHVANASGQVTWFTDCGTALP
jgi:hypothetical protein